MQIKTKNPNVSTETKEVKMIKVNLDDLKLYFNQAEPIDTADLKSRLGSICEQSLNIEVAIRECKALFTRIEFIKMIKDAD